MDFEKELFDSIDKRLTSIETKLDASLTHCETVCEKKFAPVGVKADVDELKKFMYKAAGGFAVLLFIIGLIIKFI